MTLISIGRAARLSSRTAQPRANKFPASKCCKYQPASNQHHRRWLRNRGDLEIVEDYGRRTTKISVKEE